VVSRDAAAEPGGQVNKPAAGNHLRAPAAQPMSSPTTHSAKQRLAGQRVCGARRQAVERGELLEMAAATLI